MELKNKVAIVTGASGRLGSAIAIELAKAGCKCVCHYFGGCEKAEGVESEIRGMGGEVILVEADLRSEEGVESLFAEVKNAGRPSILVNSAAVFERGALSEVTFESARGVMDLNLITPIMTSRAFAEAAEGGKIVNICDVGGLRGWAEYSVYCASKAGLIGATKSLAKELAPAICVNAVAPGVIHWPSDFDEEEKQRQLAFIPVRRKGEERDVTRAVIFLLENDYITGQVLSVDGGRSI